MIESTSQAISDLINGDVSSAAKLAHISPTTPSATTISSSKGGINLEVAWNILQDKSTEASIDSVYTELNRIGLTEMEDLTLLDESDVMKLADALKAIPKKKFLKAMNR